MICDRCNVEMRLEPMREGSRMDGWYCPCCKCRTRTAEMIEADAVRRAAERGITVEELREESRALINPQPLSPAALAGLRSRVAERASEWKPTCEHDTNPWRASCAEGASDARSS